MLARENVLAFNTVMVKEDALPASLLDLAKPEWKGKVAIAPTDADFLPLVGAVVALKGKAAALEWLKGLRENATLFDDDEGVVAAVDRGAVATGVINNYYWARLRTEKGADKMQSAIHHFAGGDVGGADQRLRRGGAEEPRATRRRRRSSSPSSSASRRRRWWRSSTSPSNIRSRPASRRTRC